MAYYLFRQASGPDAKTAMLYSRCRDESYCQAELILLAETAPAGTRVLGCYDVDQSFSVTQFLKSYEADGRDGKLKAMVKTVQRDGFNYPKVGLLEGGQIGAIVNLVPGVKQQTPTPEQQAERIASLRATIEEYLPEFAKSIKAAAAEKSDKAVFLHQDAFAAGYDMDEYTLLGMAIKYAGLSGVTIKIHGKNHETF